MGRTRAPRPAEETRDKTDDTPAAQVTAPDPAVEKRIEAILRLHGMGEDSLA